MNLPDIVDAMVASGSTPEQIAVVVRAAFLSDESALAKRRQADKERQAKRRHVMSRDVTLVTRDVCDKKGPTSPPKDNNQNPHTTTQNQDETSSRSSVSQKSDLAEAVEIFNLIAGKTGWSKVETLNDVRKGKLRGRIKDAGGLVGWNEALERGARSNFLLGDNDKGWKAGFDFFLSQEKFTKLLEGNYDNRPQNRRNQPAGPRESAYVTILHDALAAEYRAGGDGIPSRDADHRPAPGGFDFESRSDRGLFAGLQAEPGYGSGLNVVDLVPLKGSRS